MSKIIEAFLEADNFIAVDTETTGLEQHDRPYQISFCDMEGNTELVEWGVQPKTRKVLTDKKGINKTNKLIKGKRLVFHNKPFDIRMLEAIGIDIDWKQKSYDTSNLSHLFHSGHHSAMQGRLKPLALFYLDFYDGDEKELKDAVRSARLIGKKLGWNLGESLEQDYWMPKAVYEKAQDYLPELESDIHPWSNVSEKYAVKDAERTMLLFMFFRNMIKKKWKPDDPRLKVIESETLLSDSVYKMTKAGLPSLPEKFPKEIKKHSKIINDSLTDLQMLLNDPEFNIASSDQLRNAFYEKLEFPVFGYTPTNQPSTDKTTREQLVEWLEIKQGEKISKNDKSLRRKQQRFLDLVQLNKNSTKMSTDLLRFQKMIIGSRAYYSINQSGTDTTRFSSNLHNIKKPDKEKDIHGLRHLFGPEFGRCWFCLDYSQLQLRIFAFVTEEKSMIEAFENGYDFHAFVASVLYKKDVDKVTKSERRIAKNCNFGFIFGASPRKIELTAGQPGLWKMFCDLFPSAHRFMESTKKKVRRLGYVDTPHGSRLYVNQAHKGVNYIVQGCEGDIVKKGMVNCDRILSRIKKQDKKFDGEMVFQIHDELIFDFPKRKNFITKKGANIIELIKGAMEQPADDVGMVCPVDIDYTDTDWGEVKEYKIGV